MLQKGFKRKILLPKTQPKDSELLNCGHLHFKSNLKYIGNPGGPVVSSVNCHISDISKFVGYHLQPIVQQIPSYMQDTSDFLRKINKNRKKYQIAHIQYPLDVRSLYTSIPNSEGIKTVKTPLDNLPSYKSNHYFSAVNFDVKQFCVQLQKLFPNKRLFHGNNLRYSIC